MNSRIILFSLLSLMVLISLNAQPEYMSKETRDRIEAQRVAFITQHLKLTPAEAEKFWPVYNEYRDALKDMRDDFERPDLENISDDEASAMIERHLQQEQQRLELKEDLIVKLKKVISPRKILMLQSAEMAFNRELLRKVQERREK